MGARQTDQGLSRRYASSDVAVEAFQKEFLIGWHLPRMVGLELWVWKDCNRMIATDGRNGITGLEHLATTKSNWYILQR